MEYMEQAMQQQIEGGASEAARCYEEIEELKAERDALLQELHKANSIIIDLQRNPPKFTAEHLRDVQAEAGRVGFIEGIRLRSKAPCNDWELAADEYAATVRQGGAE